MEYGSSLFGILLCVCAIDNLVILGIAESADMRNRAGIIVVAVVAAVLVEIDNDSVTVLVDEESVVFEKSNIDIIRPYIGF